MDRHEMGDQKEPSMVTRYRTSYMWAVGLVWIWICVAGQPADGQPRIIMDLDAGWLFNKADMADAAVPGFDDSGWARVDLPHDWSIAGPFGPEYGSGNGFAPGGIAWYRRHLRLDAGCKDKAVAIEFDGVYDHAEVWVNGHFVGRRPYGYSSFQCELAPLLRFGDAENVVAVRVDHSRFADSRWYTGSGIYRHVRLRITDRFCIGHWGTSVTTPQVQEASAVVQVETTIHNGSGQARAGSLELEVRGPDGRVVATAARPCNAEAGTDQNVVQQVSVSNPKVWSIESPVLYTLISTLKSEGAVLDQTTTQFGIRTIRFDPDKGFFLNGRSMKLKGVCIHHDAGPVGAAVPDKVLERRLLILKGLGVNAIRTSHNPPAPELLDLCDRLGLLVKDEAFDEFTPAKNKWVTGRNAGQPSRFGYAELFRQWSVTDIQDMVRRDRNHPCVILWSIGNEIDFANDPFTHPVLGNDYRPGNPPAENLTALAAPLIAAVKQIDPTRPVTAALANVAMSDAVGLGAMLDVVGYNYQEPRYPADHQKYPKRILFGSENSHAYNAWIAVRDNDYVAGQFLWTGIDYLGEANRWPNRGSGAGLLDLCGFKKPNAWFRQSLWSDGPMVYLCASTPSGGRGMRFRGMRAEEHWNWPSDANVTVTCYTNCPQVRLTLNASQIGLKPLTEAVNGTLTWQVPFEPGQLKAEGLKEGKTAAEFVLATAGAASRIALVPDVTQLAADGKDICHVEFRITDGQGVLVPDANQEVTFEVSGPATILAVGNADLNSPDSTKDLIHKAHRGRGLVILQAGREAGAVRVTAKAQGLEPASLEIQLGTVR
jgi:beta-galactosidase